MEMIIVLVAIIKSVATSLGVGGSTLAIVNFFVAIADGRIDENERRMMGVVYIVLRVVMVVILLTTCILIGYNAIKLGAVTLTPYVFAQLTIITMLYSNAVLMTMRVMPSTVGPALQAASWYTLGIMAALVPLALADFSYMQFVLGYLAAIMLAVSVVNGLMAYLKARRQNKEAATTDGV